ncbi:MAG: dephospho-CoA kinase [Alphaproteobacteria bacterium]
MLLVGLTGSIGMGKSETSRMIREEGVKVYDADAEVHKLYARGGAAVAPIGALFPDVIVDGAIDRARLSKHVVGNDVELKKLESVIHPMVGLVQAKQLLAWDDAGEKIVVMDVPLLYEGTGHERVDRVIVVSAPFDVQKKRVLARDDMTEDKFKAILEKQVADDIKRKKADFVIDTHHGLDHAHDRVREILKHLESVPAEKFDRAGTEAMVNALEAHLKTVTEGQLA